MTDPKRPPVHEREPIEAIWRRASDAAVSPDDWLETAGDDDEIDDEDDDDEDDDDEDEDDEDEDDEDDDDVVDDEAEAEP